MGKHNAMSKAGRPTKYKPEYCDQVEAYFREKCPEDSQNTHLPKIESFARYIGISRKTLYNWEEKHPEFGDALDEIRTRQAEQLIDDGIYGGREVNATIVKLLLQNNHGMRERRDVTSDDKPLDTFTDEQVDRIAERIAERSGSDGDTSGKEKSD